MTEDYYSLLGVDREASEEVILQAYREKAAEHHPDVSEAADAETTFRRLNRAKEVLTDAHRRRKYDRIGHDQFVDQIDSDHSTDKSPVNVRQGTGPTETDPDWPTGLGSFFEYFFSGAHLSSLSTNDHRRWYPGSVRYPWSPIDLESHIDDWAGASPSNGRIRRTNSRSTEDSQHSICPKCRGRGSFVHEIDTARGVDRRIEPCERCQGSGSVPE